MLMNPQEKDKKQKARPKFQPLQSRVSDDKLTIDYNKDELKHLLPELTREIDDKTDKRISFGEMIEELDNMEMYEDTLSDEENTDEEWEQKRDQELKNPDAISFIRRCSTIEEALQIIDFLEKRGELTSIMATKYRNQLHTLGLESFGPKKEPGYYERAYPRRIQLRKINFRMK